MNVLVHSLVNVLMKTRDRIAEDILALLDRSLEPLETKDIENVFQTESRTKILNRLKELRGEGLIKGKMVGPCKGTWIWWKKDAFRSNGGIND